MAEPPAAAPAGVAASGQDVLLATKLHVPGPRPGFVPRPRLAGLLGGGLVLVCAPAGFGKTALLADWLRSSGRPEHGCRWTSATTTRCGSGGMWWPRWTGRGRGSASGSPRCSARRRPRLRGW